jgi:hypothetical protein
MAAVSTHLHNKPYQVANTTDPTLIFRKWNHLGNHYCPSPRSAAYSAYKGEGHIESESYGAGGIIYRFSCGLYISVGF